jgi:hypothetical protein
MLMIVSAVIGGWSDLQFSYVGYAWQVRAGTLPALAVHRPIRASCFISSRVSAAAADAHAHADAAASAYPAAAAAAAATTALAAPAAAAATEQDDQPNSHG